MDRKQLGLTRSWLSATNVHKRVTLLGSTEQKLVKTAKDHEDAYADEDALKIYRMITDNPMSVKDKVGLGYGSFENELYVDNTPSIFNSRPKDWLGKPLYSWFTREGDMHGVTPPMTGNYMPSPVHVEIDESQFSYDQKQTNISETSSKNVETCESNKTDAPIIEEGNEYVVTPGKENEKPSHTDHKSAKFIKTPSDIGNKHDSRRHMDKQVGEGYAFQKKVCFAYGSLSHLIKDHDFHEERMSQDQAVAKQTTKTNEMGNFNRNRDKMPTWENTQRVGPSNKFVPRAVLLQSVNTGRQNLPTLVPTSKPVSTGKPVHVGRPNYPKLVASGWKNYLIPGNPHKLTEDLGIVDSSYSRSTTRNRYKLKNFQEFKGRNVTFGGGEERITGKGPAWYFDLDYLPDLMDYSRVRSTNPSAGPSNATTNNVGSQDTSDSNTNDDQDVIILPSHPFNATSSSSSMEPQDSTGDTSYASLVVEETQAEKDELASLKRQEQKANEEAERLGLKFAQDEEDLVFRATKSFQATSTNVVSPGSTPVSLGSIPVSPSSTPVSPGSIPVSPGSTPVTPGTPVTPNSTPFATSTSPGILSAGASSLRYPQPSTFANEFTTRVPNFKGIYDNPGLGVFTYSLYNDEEPMADLTNRSFTINVNPTSTKRINSAHPSSLINGDIALPV
ncbi:hypothetical protein Tco_1405057 [Tanacetum coccineum]